MRKEAPDDPGWHQHGTLDGRVAKKLCEKTQIQRGRKHKLISEICSSRNILKNILLVFLKSTASTR